MLAVERQHQSDLAKAPRRHLRFESGQGKNLYARDKKLVYAKRREVVTFKDGERIHLWITRSFEGDLILKSGSEILMKLTPNQVDKHQYDDAPKTKPAPIIVALGSANATNTPASVKSEKLRVPTEIATPSTSAAPIGEQCSIVCVVEAEIKGAPASLDEFFKKGGGSLA